MADHRPLWVFGDAGQAREVEELARVVGCERWNPITRLDEWREAIVRERGGDAVLGVGSPPIKEQIARRYADAVGWPVLVHPRADVGPGNTLADGVLVASGSTVTIGVEIGAWSMLNTQVTVGHDARIGRYCQLNPHATVSGGVTVEDGVLIGAGAVVLEGLTLGRGARVGAGAVVVADVDVGTTVVGIPARPMTERKPS